MTVDDTSSMRKVKILGVGGGIGAGKSTACKLLVNDLGCIAHIDADSVAHTVYAPGSQAVEDLVKEFGRGILQASGEIDRKKLGAIVFADRSAMHKLEEIVWPHTRSTILKQIDGTADEGIVIVEAAMLLDAEWNDFLDGLWIVRADYDVALQRLIDTRGWTKEEAEQRIKAQHSRRGVGNLDEEVGNKLVTGVIDNSGSLDELKEALTKKLKDPSAWYSCSDLHST